jgi:hypothetical protein
MPSGSSDRGIHTIIDRNTRKLVHLQAGMFAEYVSDMMGEPQRPEGYPWGTVWLYRTARTPGARGTPETDVPPLVFNQQGILCKRGRIGPNKRLKEDLTATQGCYLRDGP